MNSTMVLMDAHDLMQYLKLKQSVRASKQRGGRDSDEQSGCWPRRRERLVYMYYLLLKDFVFIFFPNRQWNHVTVYIKRLLSSVYSVICLRPGGIFTNPTLIELRQEWINMIARFAESR
ncbi:hypothetical protein AVEN_216346-1 [Araneus ventricosus]|uniref:Uncharacterized protein n=1 Tax=Araneus ventricosus TaxID=182803 RepID=A0A4Y2P3Y1_ARAVE|nr:hypothetical protein AVEN_216346-1 [Araneus ventricosus]